MIYLNINYEQREIAKSNGAKWDSTRKQWYHPGSELPEPLKQFQAPKFVPGSTCRCKICGQSGQDGAYPFSTLRGSSICDDCI